jgi:hypothetical protein
MMGHFLVRTSAHQVPDIGHFCARRDPTCKTSKRKICYAHSFTNFGKAGNCAKGNGGACTVVEVERFLGLHADMQMYMHGSSYISLSFSGFCFVCFLFYFIFPSLPHCFFDAFA